MQFQCNGNEACTTEKCIISTNDDLDAATPTVCPWDESAVTWEELPEKQ